jgi:hypothetical protein
MCTVKNKKRTKKIEQSVFCVTKTKLKDDKNIPTCNQFVYFHVYVGNLIWYATYITMQTSFDLLSVLISS